MNHDALIDAMLAQAEPFTLIDAIPPALRGALLEVAWDLNRLWGIRHQPTQIDVADLRWYYPVPCWQGDGGCCFRVTPADVIAQPGRYPEHEQRIADADLTHPIHIVKRHERWLILDGVHRLVKADRKGDSHIAAIVLTPHDIETITQPGAHPQFYAALHEYWISTPVSGSVA